MEVHKGLHTVVALSPQTPMRVATEPPERWVYGTGSPSVTCSFPPSTCQTNGGRPRSPHDAVLTAGRRGYVSNEAVSQTQGSGRSPPTSCDSNVEPFKWRHRAAPAPHRPARFSIQVCPVEGERRG